MSPQPSDDQLAAFGFARSTGDNPLFEIIQCWSETLLSARQVYIWSVVLRIGAAEAMLN